MEQSHLPSPRYETRPAQPGAAALIETLRAVGYSIGAAVADIVDNAISARARKIEVHFEWAGPDSFITVSDDGIGMSDAGIVEALRPGSRNPLDERDPADLGRFGLGLKTASFSQGRQLVVISRQEGAGVNYWAWDLDHVAETNSWEVLRMPGRPELVERLSEQERGTIILWQQLDRAPGTSGTAQEDERLFLEAAKKVKRHLGMVFHRFIEDGRIRLTFNGLPVEPWDPFLRGKEGTQPLAGDRVESQGVVIRPYVLPHRSKLSEEQYAAAAGPSGWAAMQGFYIYRNERLLVGGGWLGLYRREEHYRLARILVDITNATDVDWQIDIKKASARPPDSLRAILRRIADYARGRAEAVYRHRGSPLTKRAEAQEAIPVWGEYVRHGKRLYRVNREHPAAAALLQADSETARRTATLLRLIEETVPTPLIYYREASEPDGHAAPLEGVPDSEVFAIMRDIYDGLRLNQTHEEALKVLRRLDPFASDPDLITRFDLTL